jgi:ABC-type transporter Mla maintaining outer membrane lipid asymmetry ATPase subunit MlaF
MHDVGDRIARNADRVDAVMRIEAAVLDGNERLRQIGRQVLQRDIGAGQFAARYQQAAVDSDGGIIKRAALARALALDPTLLFLDEPTAGLDPISAAAFDELVVYLHRGLKLTIVMITHDLDTLLATCNRVAVLIDRKIVVDTLDGIMKNPHPWIKEYFHGPRARAAVASARQPAPSAAGK